MFGVDELVTIVVHGSETSIWMGLTDETASREGGNDGRPVRMFLGSTLRRGPLSVVQVASILRMAQFESYSAKSGWGETAMKLCIRIFQNEHGDFTASCPSLPGCMSRGQTREEASEKLDEVIRGYLASVSNFVPEHVTHEVLEV